MEHLPQHNQSVGMPPAQRTVSGIEKAAGIAKALPRLTRIAGECIRMSAGYVGQSAGLYVIEKLGGLVAHHDYEMDGGDDYAHPWQPGGAPTDVAYFEGRAPDQLIREVA